MNNEGVLFTLFHSYLVLQPNDEQRTRVTISFRAEFGSKNRNVFIYSFVHTDRY